MYSFLPHGHLVHRGEMNMSQMNPKGHIYGEAISTIELKIDYSSGVENKLLFKPPYTLSTVKWLVPYHKKFLPLIMVGLFPQDNIPVPVPVPES